MDDLKSLHFEARLDLEEILNQGFVCWNNLVLILKQMLILWSGLVWFFFGIIIHSHSSPFLWWQSSDFFSISSKHAWFTFSPFVKQILFYIIKTCMIYTHFYFVSLRLTLVSRSWPLLPLFPWRGRIQKIDTTSFLLPGIPRSLQSPLWLTPTKSPQTWSTLATGHNTERGMRCLQQTLLSWKNPSFSHMPCGRLDVELGSSVALTLVSWLVLGSWLWHDRTFFFKEGAWVDPMFARIKIVMINTSTSCHRRGMMNVARDVYAMHDKTTHSSTDTRVQMTILSYLQCIGYHGSFAKITMVPNACN